MTVDFKEFIQLAYEDSLDLKSTKKGLYANHEW